MARAFTVNGRSFHWSFDRGRADVAVLHGALDPLVGQALVVKLRPGDAQGMVAGRSFSSPIVGSACSGAAGGVSSPVGGA